MATQPSPAAPAAASSAGVGKGVVYGVHEFSAENGDEISFAAGEEVIVLEKDDQYGDGWWQVSTVRSVSREGDGEGGGRGGRMLVSSRPTAACVPSTPVQATTAWPASLRTVTDKGYVAFGLSGPERSR